METRRSSSEKVASSSGCVVLQPACDRTARRSWPAAQQAIALHHAATASAPAAGATHARCCCADVLWHRPPPCPLSPAGSSRTRSKRALEREQPATLAPPKRSAPRPELASCLKPHSVPQLESAGCPEACMQSACGPRASHHAAPFVRRARGSSGSSSDRKRKTPAKMSDRTDSASGAHSSAPGGSAAAGSSSGSSAGEPPRRATALDEAEQEALDRLEESAANAASWGAPSNALHGLLRKLGAGLDDLLPSISASHSKLKVILQGLKAEDDGRQLVSLNELCELLSIGAGAPAPRKARSTARTTKPASPCFPTLANGPSSPHPCMLEPSPSPERWRSAG